MCTNLLCWWSHEEHSDIVHISSPWLSCQKTLSGATMAVQCAALSTHWLCNTIKLVSEFIIIIIICETWDYHGSEDPSHSLLGYDTVWCCGRIGPCCLHLNDVITQKTMIWIIIISDRKLPGIIYPKNSTLLVTEDRHLWAVLIKFKSQLMSHFNQIHIRNSEPLQLNTYVSLVIHFSWHHWTISVELVSHFSWTHRH